MSENSYCKGNHILVGLGGTGGKILKAFKMRMFEEFTTPEERAKLPVSLLYVDSTDEMMPQDGRPRQDCRVMGQDASFTNNEFLNIKAVDVDNILDHINNYPSVKGIVENVNAVRTAIGALGIAAGQKRRAGRLLFAANAVAYAEAIQNAYARAEAISGNEGNTVFHIFAGLAGGTGSGSIIDAIVQTRKRFPNSVILAYVMIPEKNLPKSDMDQGRYYPNGYAAINELNALQTGKFKPQDVTGYGQIDLFNSTVKGVANGLTIYSNVNENGVTVNSLNELPKIMSDLVFSRIFLFNGEDSVYEDIMRAFNFENMDDFALEYDENGVADASGKLPVARTKKINSYGIKRVMYPELRVLKHITYSVGESVLLQFKYNNWRENLGYVKEERNKDYRAEYLSKANLQKWMLDQPHLTLDVKILPTDTDYPAFREYWHEKAIGYSEEAKNADCPLNELDNILKEFYDKHFREEGVESYFSGKEKSIPDMAREIRHNIENELFEKWKTGDISIVELKKVSSLLLERMGEIRKELESASKEETENNKAIDEERTYNVADWKDLGILQRMVGKGARLYAGHQEILSDLYESRTRLVALDFAKKLAAKIFTELGKMDSDVSTFGQKISDALTETERLVTAQRKVNKGLEDMKGAIIEVCEEEKMSQFEADIKVDKLEMPNIARALRQSILPQTDFINFGNLASEISVDEITNAFDVKLSEIVRTKHAEKVDNEEKVLGLNILTQLQQKLRTDEDINKFAYDIVSKSGVFLKLNNDQMRLHLRNNEGNLSPTNTASINKKTILVSIPAPDDNENLKKFADKLENAFRNSVSQGTGRTDLIFNKKSPRKDELSVIMISYCYPARAIDWLYSYREKYERFLQTGNPNTDASNSILLHSEGNGKDLPPLFAQPERDLTDAMTQHPDEAQYAYNQQGSVQQSSVSPIIPPAGPGIPPSGPCMPPPPQMSKPQISLFIYVDRQYGPYNYDQCEQMKGQGILTPQTNVWMEGMANWQPAGQVAQLAMLFAPTPPTPPMPPMPGGGMMPPATPQTSGFPPM